MNSISILIISTVLIVSYVNAYPQYVPFSPAPPKYFAGPPAPVPPQVRYTQVSPSPVAPKQYAEAGKDQYAQTVSEYRDVNFDGTFNYGFETNNGIAVKAEGYINDANSEYPEQVIKGTYFYYDKENKPVNVVFVADKYGFRAESDVIPKPSPQILKSLEINAAAEAAGKIQH